MRIALLLALTPFPAHPWEFSAEPICTLSHQTDAAHIAITYDASLPEYALTITLERSQWPREDTFHLVFLGPPQRQIITTSRHSLSDEDRTLTVRDRGFGNVLDGMEFRPTGVARTGSMLVNLELTDADAAPAVRAFRACPPDAPATS